MCRFDTSDEEKNTLRASATIKKRERECHQRQQRGSPIEWNDRRGEDTAMGSEPEDDEDEREMEPADWPVRVGPRSSPTPERCDRAEDELHRDALLPREANFSSRVSDECRCERRQAPKRHGQCGPEDRRRFALGN